MYFNINIFVCKKVIILVKKIKMALAFFALATVGLMEAKAATDYNWTQVSRWREGVRYNQDGATIYPQEWYPAKGYDVRPHKQLYKMFPELVVGDGNNKATSDNLWKALLNSPNVIGNSSNLVRAHDISEDWDINFVDPNVSNKNYWTDWYVDKGWGEVPRGAYPLTLTGGPQAGQSLLGNNNLLAMGDDKSVWLDVDGTLSYYNYFTGTLAFDSKKTAFSGGAAGWSGASLTGKLGNMIGFEQNNLYFLEGANTVHVYNYDLGFVRTDEFRFDGDLAGRSLADLIDGKVDGYSYLGWDLGPVVVGVSAVSPVPEPSSMAMWLIGGGLLAARLRKKRKGGQQA
ncbi:PEP-CTERM sorting domain-containing protein [Janthinobacterium sp. LB2P10]|uniref:PEP-CTERM sorting domain-containing protein n=1 Tax=Janthinobacterium sp. LB2P10 TaxID=3424194 RepID=UPI000804D949